MNGWSDEGRTPLRAGHRGGESRDDIHVHRLGTPSGLALALGPKPGLRDTTTVLMVGCRDSWHRPRFLEIHSRKDPS